MRRRRLAGVYLALVALVLPLTSCMDVAPSLAVAHSAQGEGAQPVPGEGVAGSLVEATLLTDVDPAIKSLGATSVRMLYRSTSGLDGSTVEVSGTAFIPAGAVPRGGWPVVAIGHMTSGINYECAPSLYSDLLGVSASVALFLREGYAVAVTDYQGLGTPGVHPYLDNNTAGLNIIDSVRALRAYTRTVSRRWAAYGISQGGGAAWAANEEAAFYAPELRLVGSVSLVPLPDPSELALAAQRGDLTFDQMSAYIWVLMGLERRRPDFHVDDYRHGLATENWNVLSVCRGPDAAVRADVLSRLVPADFYPSSQSALEIEVGLLKRMAVPQRRASAPLFVIYGDEDTFVDPDWTRTAIDEACALGSRVAALLEVGKGHTDVDGGGSLAWLMRRFDGLPAATNC